MLPVSVIRRPASAAAALDPIRQRLLSHLREPDSATGVARRLRLPRQKVNYHLRALEEAGLVELVEERRKGNCLERVVRASAQAFVISPEALGAVAPRADLTADRLSSAYLIGAAGRTIRDLAELESRAPQVRQAPGHAHDRSGCALRQRARPRGVRRGARRRPRPSHCQVSR